MDAELISATAKGEFVKLTLSMKKETALNMDIFSYTDKVLDIRIPDEKEEGE